MNKKDIIKAYKRYSSIYSILFGKIFNKGRHDAIKLMRLVGHEKILEVGVGSGLSLKKYPDSTNIIGIDISESMIKNAELEIAANNLKNIELKIEDAEKMTFHKNSFDKVVIMYTLSVTPNPKKLLTMAKNVCKNNGDIIILNHFNTDKTIWRFIYGKILKYIERKVGFRMYFPLDRCIAHIKKLGAVDVNVLSTNFGFSKIIHIKNKKQEIDKAFI